jgi:hypothetical protein
MKAVRKAKRKFRMAGTITFDDREPCTMSVEAEAYNLSDFMDAADDDSNDFEALADDIDAREHCTSIQLTIERLT